MKISFLYILIISILFYGCKKSEPIVFSGQLLLTKKNPVPLINRKIEIFQLGGSGIIMGSSGASASTITDVNGRFSLTFVPGKSYFAGFSGGSISPLTLTSIEGYPFFIKNSFPEIGYDKNMPIYIGKSIDSLIIKFYSFKNISPLDTLAIKGSSIDSVFEKRYTGITADSLTTFNLDTIYNVLFTEFDCNRKIFRNNIQFGELKRYSNPTNGYFIGESYILNELSMEDETKREMTFYFNY